ncbi:MAG: hypothetical protein AAF581_18510 [Planctomycetota bacterium]
MPDKSGRAITHLQVRGAREHNLKGLDVDLPHDQLVVFTGVSGSGKSSLAFDTIFRESERRSLSNLGGRAGRLAGRMQRPSADSIDGVRPAIAVDQNSHVSSSRSTVGTLSEIGDELRLLFARFGDRHCPECGEEVETSAPRNRAFTCPCGATLSAMTRSLFSFNTNEGACPACRGLGEQEEVDPALIVADPTKTLREGALVPTTPNGYIVYSQVTPESMNEVCQAHGFSIDIPWCDLTEEMRHVIFYGSDRVKVAFGKHSLESRMKWSGIKAKPRELGYYRGVARVIAETLEKKRNANILRFVTSRICGDCDGSRLSAAARAAKFRGQPIEAFHRSTFRELARLLGEESDSSDSPHGKVVEEIRARILQRATRMERLGLGHLVLSRRSSTLSSGESRRLKLAVQLGSELVGINYILDEPGAGLHPQERAALISMLCELRDRGNSVYVVEHDPMFEAHADHIVEIGPDAGSEGGELLFSGTPAERDAPLPAIDRSCNGGFAPETDAADRDFLELRAVSTNNLKNLNVRFQLGAINIVSGLSGTGKTSLVTSSVVPWINDKRDSGLVVGAEEIKQVLLVDQKPIGRNTRSNPATWTGIFDYIRTLFAETRAAQAAGLGKGHFSCNKKGGRCEACEGAGSETIGLMDMPSLVLTCAQCNGARFDAATLAIKYAGYTIREVLECTVDEAAHIFANDDRIARVLAAMQKLGLGYLQLGQPAPTLSGGEAQRLKLADKLARTGGRGTLIVLDEVSCGLHGRDVQVLSDALRALVDDGATIIAADHDLTLTSQADWVIELGPEPAAGGGEIIFEGTPAQLVGVESSPTGAALAKAKRQPVPAKVDQCEFDADFSIPTRLKGVETNNLKDVSATFESGALTAVTGVSGSGKTSLAFDTLAAIGRARFAESFSPFLRREIRSQRTAEVAAAVGVRATIAIKSKDSSQRTLATVGTASGIDVGLRLLYSRATAKPGEELPASAFSFNNVLGACPVCEGRGQVQRCHFELLVPDPGMSVADGALAQTAGGRLLFDQGGRLEAVLVGAARVLGVDLDVPVAELPPAARDFLRSGTGERVFEVDWEKARAKGEQAHRFSSVWQGVEALVEAEYIKKRERKAGPQLAALLRPRPCQACSGSRLTERVRNRRVGPWTISDLRRLEVAELSQLLQAPVDHAQQQLDPRARAILEEIAIELQPRLERLVTLGLGYLATDRDVSSLSTGEARRLDLARQLTTGLTGACYVLDEPGLGLHAKDKEALGSVLRDLAATDNTVVFVDHDPTLIRQADYIVDVGPGAGVHGGTIVAQGDVQALMSNEASRTGRVLREEASFVLEHQPSVVSPALACQVKGASRNNLRGIDLDIFYGEVLAVCGVSGSGKSTLLLDVLAPSITTEAAVGCESFIGSGQTELVKVDGRSQGRGAASIVATSLDVMDVVRKAFAKSDDARSAGLKPGDFSFSGKTGRCTECQGTGSLVMVLDFLPDADAPCPACDGSRYNDSVRAVRWQGISIVELLATDTQSLAQRFSLPPKLQSACDRLQELGLGHLSLGRRCDTLSGGESQRLAITRQLFATQRAGEQKVFIFDEPSRGLHIDDQAELVQLFVRLTQRGDAVVLSEHSLPLIRCAHRVIELGPGAGRRGGAIVYEGTPDDLGRQDTPTGRALRLADKAD